MIEILEAIDRSAGEPVLVFGSLPPGARDIDILAQPEAETRIADALIAENFMRSRHHFVRFHSCSADAVDLIPARSWNLPARSLNELFEAAVPIEGFQHVRRPAPHHALLILARRVVRGEHQLPPKHSLKVTRSVDEDPAAWEKARSIAEGWNAVQALGQLQTMAAGSLPSRSQRARAILEEERTKGTGNLKAFLGLARSSGSSRRGAIVTLSGVDGSGKSSQGEALKAALERSGFDVALEWTKIARNPSLDVIARPVKGVMRLIGSKRSEPVSAPVEEDPARVLRRRSPAMTQAWTVIVALTNSKSHRRATRSHLKAGRIVVCDRYVLDSAAHLRYRYGAERRFRFQSWLVKLLSPKPLKAYFLDVPPEEALRRKTEQYDLEQMTLLVRLYREEHERMGVELIDGTTPLEDLCRALATNVWTALRS